MTTLKAGLKAYLINDTLLSSILTGGILDADDLGRDGFNRDNHPASWDTTLGVLKPTLILKWGFSYPNGPHYNAERGLLECYLYESHGYINIERAKSRLKSDTSAPGQEFLHRKVFGAFDDVNFAGFQYAGCLGNYTDDTIDNGASMDICRFVVYSTRKVITA